MSRIAVDIRSSTLATPTLSDALAVSVVVVETELPLRGAVIETFGGVVSVTVTVAVGLELAVADPPGFFAVTVTRRTLPASLDATVYDDVVEPAPDALVQVLPLLELCHW